MYALTVLTESPLLSDLTARGHSVSHPSATEKGAAGPHPQSLSQTTPQQAWTLSSMGSEEETADPASTPALYRVKLTPGCSSKS